MPNAPLKHVAGSTVTTVVDPRFGTSDTPTQPAGWGGGGTSAPPPLTGATYTAPGVYIPSGALDVWRAARVTTSSQSVEVTVFGDSITYGSAVGSYYSWIKATKDKAAAAGHPDGGHGYLHPMDSANNYAFSTDAPTVLSGATAWRDPSLALHSPWTSRTGTGEITIRGNGTRIRLVIGRSNMHGRIAWSVDGGPEVEYDAYRLYGPNTNYDFHPVYIDGLTDGPHDITVRALGASPQNAPSVYAEFTVEFLRNTGLVFHRNATSGGSMGHHFDAITNNAGSWASSAWNLGLESANNNKVSSNDWVDGANIGAKPTYRNVKLSIAQMGTNDLSGATFPASPDQVAGYIENMAYWARSVRNAGASGLIVIPPMSQIVAPGHRHAAGQAKAMLVGLATGYGVALADFQEAMGYDLHNWGTKYVTAAGPGNSHLSAAAFAHEGNWLWDHVLSL